eukprot:g2282.t1
MAEKGDGKGECGPDNGVSASDLGQNAGQCAAALAVTGSGGSSGGDSKSGVSTSVRVSGIPKMFASFREQAIREFREYLELEKTQAWPGAGRAHEGAATSLSASQKVSRSDLTKVFLQIYFPSGVPPLPKRCQFHFFISKHEKYKKDAWILGRWLESLGFKVWLSNFEKYEGREMATKDMQEGIRKSAVVIILLSKGVFHENRHYVWDKEINYAITRQNKPLIMLRLESFRDDDNHKCCSDWKRQHKAHHYIECCESVAEEFQPTARALLNSLTYVKWKFDSLEAQTDLFEKFWRIQNDGYRLQPDLLTEIDEQRKIGACPRPPLSSAGKANKNQNSPEIELPKGWRYLRVRLPLAAPKQCQHFQNRPALLDKVLKSLDEGGAVGLVGIKGQGGVGKSEALKWLARHQDVQSKFDVTWVQAGQKERVRDLLHQLARHTLQIDFDNSVDVDDAKRYLHERIVARTTNADVGKRLLVIIDDIWKPEQISVLRNVMKPAMETADCQVVMLFSSRKRSVLPEGTRIYPVETFSPDTSCALLVAHAKRTGREETLNKIAELCGHIPIALKVVGKMGGKKKWSVVLRKLERNAAKEIEITDRDDGGYGKVVAAFTAGLDPEWLGEGGEEGRELYEKYLMLSVFPEDTEVHVEALRVLWGEVDEGDTEEWLEKLENASLLEMRGYQQRSMQGLTETWTCLVCEERNDAGIFNCALCDAQRIDRIWLHNLQHVFLRKRGGYDWLKKKESRLIQAAKSIVHQAEWHLGRRETQEAMHLVSCDLACKVWQKRCGEHTSSEVIYNKILKVLIEVVQQNWRALEYASASLKNNKEVIMAAVKQNWGALKYASASLKNDKEVVMAAVQQNGGALEYASAGLKNDKEVVMAAMRRNGSALHFAPDALKNDKEVVMAAVQQNGSALKYASAGLKNDKEIVMVAVQQNGRLLQHTSGAMK